MFNTTLVPAKAILAALSTGECTPEQAIARAQEVLARPQTKGRKAKTWTNVLAVASGGEVAETPVVEAVAVAQAQLDAAKAAHAAYVTAQTAPVVEFISRAGALDRGIAKLDTGKFMSRDERLALLAHITLA